MANNAGLDIFISISLKYPELNAVKYQVDSERIILEFAIKGSISSEKKEYYQIRITELLELFYKLSGNKAHFNDLSFKENSGITILKFHRDVNSLSEGEIELLILWLKEHFADLLFMDNSSIIAGDSFKTQVKRKLLRKVNNDETDGTNFFAYREEGRLFVFNK